MPVAWYTLTLPVHGGSRVTIMALTPEQATWLDATPLAGAEHA